MSEHMKNDEMTTANGCLNGKAESGHTPRARKSKAFWPILAAIGLVVATLTEIVTSHQREHAASLPREAKHGSSALMATEGCAPDVSSADRKREEARRREEMRGREVERIRTARRAALETYRTAIQAEYEAFTRRVDGRLDDAFNPVCSRVPSMVAEYGFKKCWSLVYALAKDKIAQKTGRGSARNFNQLMNGDLRDGFYQPLQDARGEILSLLDEFRNRLQACRADLGEDLKNIPDWDRSLGEPPDALKAESLQIEEEMSALIEAQFGASVSSACEATILPSACSCLYRLLFCAATRLAAGTTAGIATAMADGPEPGPADLVGLGVSAAGVAATAWEIRKAVKVIPDELARTMYETIETQRLEVRNRTLDEGEKLYLTCNRVGCNSPALCIAAE